jgi:hypothetical protein
MSSEELSVVAEVARETEVGPNEQVYSVGDAPGAMWMVLEGSVEILAPIGDGDEDGERLLDTVHAGGVFGWLSLIDGKTRPTTGRATGSSRLLGFDQSALDALRERAPAALERLRGLFLQDMARQVRDWIALYQGAVEWGLEVSGLVGLGLRELVGGSGRVEIRLADGELLEGSVLRFDASEGGQEVLLRTDDDRLHIVPLRSILRITLDSADSAVGPGRG